MEVVVVQMKTENSIEENLRKAEGMIEEACATKKDLVVLPEMFLCPYEAKNFPKFATKEGDYVYHRLSNMAKKHQIYLVGGSIPELDEEGRVYNTSYVFDRTGAMLGKHRKVHLFDINMVGKHCFRESDTLTAGNGITVVDTEFGKIGVCICYDIRFSELFRLMVEQGAKLIVVPACFTLTTGEAHWDIFFRVRSTENQVFMIGAAGALDENGPFQSYGHSLVVSPFGDILGEMQQEEGILSATIELKEVEKVREENPFLQHRRLDLYEVRKKDR